MVSGQLSHMMVLLFSLQLRHFDQCRRAAIGMGEKGLDTSCFVAFCCSNDIANLSVLSPPDDSPHPGETG